MSFATNPYHRPFQNLRDVETSIVANLEDNILESEAHLRSSFDVLAELDCLFSFASCASDYGYVKPTVVPSHEHCVDIKGGRHPLQELIVGDQYVANDVCFDSEKRLNVVTGPNFSGKSCYARQVGILVFMAHVGCFIPCESARISVVDSIMTRFSSAETCTVPQSSFQLDLTQLGRILQLASKSSLVVRTLCRNYPIVPNRFRFAASFRSLMNSGKVRNLHFDQTYLIS